jgi:hypothetical protein
MAEVDSIAKDLGYVRGLVETAEPHRSPSAIYLLWAVIVPVGFALADFEPRLTGLYWLIASPVGFVASTWIGIRNSRRQGQVDRREGTRHVLHWLGMMAAILLTVPLVATGAVTDKGMGQVILLLIALAYFLNGVHMERPLLWVGILMAGGYGATFLFSKHVWTMLGLVISAALVASAIVESKRAAATRRASLDAR